MYKAIMFPLFSSSSVSSNRVLYFSSHSSSTYFVTLVPKLFAFCKYSLLHSYQILPLKIPLVNPQITLLLEQEMVLTFMFTQSPQLQQIWTKSILNSQSSEASVSCPCATSRQGSKRRTMVQFHLLSRMLFSTNDSLAGTLNIIRCTRNSTLPT